MYLYTKKKTLHSVEESDSELILFPSELLAFKRYSTIASLVGFIQVLVNLPGAGY